MKAFGRILAATRKERELTQEQLARQVRVERNLLCHWEHGIRQPTLEQLVRLADILEVSLDELLGRTS